MVYGAYGELGRDFGGAPLVSEKRAWLDEHGIANPDVREEYRFLWRELQAEEAEMRDERDSKTKP